MTTGTMLKGRDLPNQSGFKFIGVTADGLFEMEIVKNSDGCHEIAGVDYETLQGWFRIAK